jgi:hypothetical protein
MVHSDVKVVVRELASWRGKCDQRKQRKKRKKRKKRGEKRSVGSREV